eukprot:SAG22_NODE_416_length_10804_cov_4.791126_5_plen_416_part_00
MYDFVTKSCSQIHHESSADLRLSDTSRAQCRPWLPGLPPLAPGWSSLSASPPPENMSCCTAPAPPPKGAGKPAPAPEPEPGGGGGPEAPADPRSSPRPAGHQLAGLTVRELKKRALGAGVPPGAVELVGDEDDPKQALISVLLERHNMAAQSATAAAKLLREELAQLRVLALKRRAATAEFGIPAEQIEQVDDEEGPKGALISLMLDAHHAAAAATPSADVLGALREELAQMRVLALKRRAAAEGVSAEQIEEVDGAESPKDALIQILLGRAATLSPTSAAAAAAPAPAVTSQPQPRGGSASLRSELSAFKRSSLRKKALEGGCSEAELEAAEDADDPRECLVALIVAQASSKPAAADAEAATQSALKTLRAELAGLRMSMLRKASGAGLCCRTWPCRRGRGQRRSTPSADIACA